MKYPDKITITELLENDGLVMANEIVKRYNTHTTMLSEIEKLQDENKHEIFVKRVYAVVGMISLTIIMILV